MPERAADGNGDRPNDGGRSADGRSADGRSGDGQRGERATDDARYVDSVVVTQTVRAVTPFVLTFGAFTMLHGTTSVGGGFQGGVVVGAALVTIAFAFGVDQTARALDGATLVRAAIAGLLVVAAVASGSLALDAGFLDPSAYDALGGKAVVYAIEAIEVGIGVTVAGVVGVLFFALAGVTR